MTSTELTKAQDNSFTLTLTVPLPTIAKGKTDALTKIAGTQTLKGFRPGKAPLHIVEKNTKPEELLQETINLVVSASYKELLQKYNLKPIVPPKIKVINPPLTFTNPWQLEITSCETPTIELGNWKERVRSAKSSDSIWTPDKKNEEGPEEKEKKQQKILSAFLDGITILLPAVLLEEELNRRLVELVDQTKQAGLSVEQYLATKGVNLEEYKKQQEAEITKGWKLTLALEQVADDEHIQVSDDEISKASTKSPSASPYLIAQLIRQQKVFDHIVKS